MNLPPYLPPVGYDPGMTAPSPPWAGGPTMTPVPIPTPRDTSPPITVPTEYKQGPFCFGLDALICSAIPDTIHIGPAKGTMFEGAGVDIPAAGFCGALLNTICGVVSAIILLTILGIAFYSFLN